MTSIEYEDIFSFFLGEVTDSQISTLSTDDAYELMIEYLHKAVANPYVRDLFNTLTLDDDSMFLLFDMSDSVDSSTDSDFVKILISKGMAIEWLKPQVRSKLNIAQYFGNSDSKFYSQSSHLEQLRGLLEDTTLEVQKLISSRGYINNSYLEES